MNLITFRKKSDPIKEEMHLEDILEMLTHYGRPTIFNLDCGWHACVNMNTTIQGGKFEIRSDFSMASPMAAARQCLERAFLAVAKDGGIQ